MGDVLLTQDEYARLKAVVVEAYALRDYLDNVRKNAMRIMPFHIEMPGLRAALNEAAGIDLDNPMGIGVKSEPITVLNKNQFQHYQLNSETPLTDAVGLPIGAIGGKITDQSVKVKPHASNANRRRTRPAKK